MDGKASGVADGKSLPLLQSKLFQPVFGKDPTPFHERVAGWVIDGRTIERLPITDKFILSALARWHGTG
jgi:hypothetical protein